MAADSEILVLGAIHTLDPLKPIVQAALVRDGRFACVGTRAACAREARQGTHRIEVGSAVPGLVDSHGHVFGLAKARAEVNCVGAPTEEACAAVAARRALREPGTKWIVGRGWDQNRWPGQEFPTCASLSRAVPDHPALLVRVDGHAAWANSRALEEARVNRFTPDPPGGRILRGVDGQPTGILIDAAIDLVAEKIPPPTKAELEKGIVAVLTELRTLGLTAVHDAGVGPTELDVYRELAADGRLPIRVYAMIDGQVGLTELEREMARRKAEPAEGFLTVRAVKLFADGALGSRGAALHEPYSDEASNRGLFVTPPGVLAEKIAAVVAASLQPCIHAIGDRAVGAVKAAILRAGPPSKVKSLRPRIEHMQVVSARDFSELAQAGVIASMQPAHATSDAGWVPSRLGADSERMCGAYAFKTALEHGMTLAFGSDFPVEEPHPLAGIYAAETRLAEGAEAPFMPRERLTREEALRGFTVGGAVASFAEGTRGIIREGFEADLSCFAGDVLTVPADRLRSVAVLAVLVAGRLVHRA